mmetsp:Transcript_4494/g.7027  ORF Transcript_4494/g.7027 Transcript_4494/m.7027 type:complete len:96 (-) Transcript_4494:204-491(-)
MPCLKGLSGNRAEAQQYTHQLVKKRHAIIYTKGKVIQLHAVQKETLATGKQKWDRYICFLFLQSLQVWLHLVLHRLVWSSSVWDPFCFIWAMDIA